MMIKNKPFLFWLLFIVSSFAWSEEETALSDETVYVVQPKSIVLRNRLELVVQGAYDAADRYIGEAGASAQLVYHIRENFAVALHGTWMFWQGDSSITQNLNSLSNAQGKPVLTSDGAHVTFVAPYVKYYRKPWLASLETQWSPFFGKVSFHDLGLGLFQFFVTAGAGATGLELRDIKNNNAVMTLPTRWAFAATLGGGLRFYFGEHFGVRIEVKDFIQPLVARSDLPFSRPANTAPAVTSFNISHSPLIQAGVSYVF